MIEYIKRKFKKQENHKAGGVSKTIRYYLFQSHVEYSVYEKVVSKDSGLWKVEKINEHDKIVRASHFDNNHDEDRVTEFTYDKNLNLVEQQDFQNFYKEPLKKTIRKVFSYERGLVMEVKVFDYYRYKTSDSYAGRTIYDYDQNDRLIREEYQNNKNKIIEIRTFTYINPYETEELRLSSKGKVREKHIHVRDNSGLEIMRKINFKPKSKDDNVFPTIYKYCFNDKGDKIRTLWTLKGEVKEDSTHEYLYSDKDWIYRTTTNSGRVIATEFRKIEM